MSGSDLFAAVLGKASSLEKKLMGKVCSPISVWNQGAVCTGNSFCPVAQLCVCSAKPQQADPAAVLHTALAAGGWVRGQRSDSQPLLLCTVTCSGEKNYCSPWSPSGALMQPSFVFSGSRWYWVICFLYTHNDHANLFLPKSQDKSSHAPAVQRSKGCVSLSLVVAWCC